MFMLNRRAGLVLALAVAFSVLAPALHAQSELSDEDLAAIERVYQTAQTVRLEYTSYIESGTNTSRISQAIYQEGVLVQQLEQEEILEASAQIIRGDNPNGYYEAVLTQRVDDGTGPLEALVEGEMRYVDGVLYVQAVVVEGQYQGASFYDGFVSFDPTAEPAPVEADVYAPFSPEGFQRTVLGEVPEDYIFSNLELLQELTSAVEVSEEVLPDGSTGERITLFFDSEGVVGILEQTGVLEQNAIFAVLATALAPDSGAEVSMVLDAEGLPYSLAVTLNVAASAVDLSLADPNFAGLTADFSISQTQENFISDIDAEFEPVTAPA